MPSILQFDQWKTTLGTFQSTVLQVITGIDVDYRSVSVGANSTIDWVSTTIVRKVPTSKILVIFSGGYATSNNNDSSTRLFTSTDGIVGTGSNSAIEQSITSPGTDKGFAQTAGSGTYSIIPSHFSYLHTPSTSAPSITYTVRLWSEAGATFYPNGDGWRGGGQQAHSIGAQLILMEIGS